MKNKKILTMLAMTVSLSFVMSACSFGGDDPKEQVVVETTPTPAPTKAPDPTPTVAPADAQSTTYTSKDKSVSIKLPDATWASKTDETNMLSFESPEKGKILILHGKGEEDMGAAVIPSTQDMAVALEQASDLVEGTDFEIQDYASNDVNGIGVYSYTVKMLNKEKSGGDAYVVNKVFANDDEFYSLAGSVIKDDADSLSKMKESIGTFQILGDSTLKSAANGKADAEGEGGGQAAGTPAIDAEGNVSDEAIGDTSKSRTIYRNSDGAALVITADANGSWVDADGNTYDFATDEDVYDQDGTDYYYHGEAADVYFLPSGDGGEEDYDDSGDYDDENYDEDYE